MSKFIFTESQLKLIKRNLNEGHLDTNDVYEAEDCEISVYHRNNNVKYNGREIDDITAPQINFKFNIDMDAKGYGITEIYPYNPNGPSEIELEVYYYSEENEDPIEDTITIPLDWENVDEEKSDDISWIGYENRIEITLKNDENGNIVVDNMTLFKNSI
jgi:hypothetical protein